MMSRRFGVVWMISAAPATTWPPSGLAAAGEAPNIEAAANADSVANVPQSAVRERSAEGCRPRTCLARHSFGNGKATPEAVAPRRAEFEDCEMQPRAARLALASAARRALRDVSRQRLTIQPDFWSANCPHIKHGASLGPSKTRLRGMSPRREVWEK